MSGRKVLEFFSPCCKVGYRFPCNISLAVVRNLIRLVLPPALAGWAKSHFRMMGKVQEGKRSENFKEGKTAFAASIASWTLLSSINSGNYSHLNFWQLKWVKEIMFIKTLKKRRNVGFADLFLLWRWSDKWFLESGFGKLSSPFIFNL